MALVIKLIARETPVPPCGLITKSGNLSKIAKRAPMLHGFLLAIQGQNVILYHPDNAAPDLPWLGNEVGYFCRYGGGLYGPVGMLLNIPNVHLPRFHQEMVSRYNIKGDLLITSDAPLALCDLDEAQSVDYIPFDLLQETMS